MPPARFDPSVYTLCPLTRRGRPRILPTMIPSHPRASALGVLLLAGGVCLLSACGRDPAHPPSSPAASTTGPTGSSTQKPAADEQLVAFAVKGRITGTESDALKGWSAGILEFRPTDPEVAVVASVLPDSGGRFTIPFSSYRWDIPYAVIAFQDANGNGQVDRGEDFVGGESRVGDYRGRNLFLIARAGTFVGDRPLELEDAEFVLDVRTR